MLSQTCIQTLQSAGVTVSIRPGGILWLSPKPAITDEVRQLASTHKAEILAELAETTKEACSLVNASKNDSVGVSKDADTVLQILCSECMWTVNLAVCDVSNQCDSPGTGQWYHFACECGNEGYICQRDYDHWKLRGGKNYGGILIDRAARKKPC